MVRLRKKSKELGNENAVEDRWSYSSNLNGPEQWKYKYPQARGKLQSPIAISETKSIYDPLLAQQKFRFNYAAGACKLTNDGYGWKINFDNILTSEVSFGCFQDVYKLHEIRCHWNKLGEGGSEHKICDFNDSGEVHLIHYNGKYGKYEEAIKYKDGLAICAVLLEECEDDNPAFGKIAHLLKHVQYKQSSVTVPNGFNAYHLIPDRRDYWTYEGSLTTPPCNECVIWIVFRDAISVSSKQLDSFRQLSANTKMETERSKINNNILCNVRPLQPLNNRLVRCSFRFGAISSNSFWD